MASHPRPTDDICDQRHRPLMWMIGVILVLVAGLVCLAGLALASGNAATNSAAAVASDLKAEIAHTNEYRTNNDSTMMSVRRELADVVRNLISMDKKIDRLLDRLNPKADWESVPASTEPASKKRGT